MSSTAVSLITSAPDGYFVQWMQVYETNIGILGSVMKALAPHFGAYALYNTDDLDILIVATRGPTLPDPDDRLLQSPLLRAELRRIGVQSVADIQTRKIGDNLTIGPLLQSLSVPPNSDFFPFVDLNAPRLRYMRDNALELPSLTLLPIPFLELLDRSAPPGATVEPSSNSVLFRDRFVQRALEIRHAVSAGSLFSLDPLSASYLLRIDMSGEQCAATAAAGRLEKRDSRSISRRGPRRTCGRPSSRAFGTKVRSSPCYRDVPGGHIGPWADLYALPYRSVTHRRSPSWVRNCSHRTLQHRPTMSPTSPR